MKGKKRGAEKKVGRVEERKKSRFYVKKRNSSVCVAKSRVTDDGHFCLLYNFIPNISKPFHFALRCNN